MRLKYTRTCVTEQHVGTQSLRENVYTRKAIVLEETTQNRNGIKKSYRPVRLSCSGRNTASRDAPHHLPFLFRIESEAKPFLLVSIVFLRRFPTTPPARRVAARRDIRRRFHLLQRLRRDVARSESSSSSSSSVFVGLITRDDKVFLLRDQLCARRHRNPRVRPTIRPNSSYLFTLYSFETSP